jgi:hypothetical protein
MTRAAVASLAVVALAVAAAPRVAAHRQDEYLQATRVSIDVDRISLDVDLTPGISVASQVLATVDSDHDGEISDDEANAYARRVVGSIALSVDDRPVPTSLIARRFPTRREMILGVGTIHLSAAARLAPAAVGVHHVSYVNAHLPELSVYLANALVPSDARVQISDQRRDFLQRGLTIEYRVTAGSIGGGLGWPLGALAISSLLAGACFITRVATDACREPC